MRTGFDGHDETEGYNKKPTNVSQPEGTSNSIPNLSTPTAELLSTAFDVEYSVSENDSGVNILSKTRTREVIIDPNPTTAELITEIEEGPRRPSSNMSSRSTAACDPEGLKQSIFNNHPT